LFTPHKNKDKQLNVAKLSISKNMSYVQYVPKEKAKLLPKTKLPHQSLVPVQCKLVYCISTKKNPMDLNKAKVEARALIIAKTFIIEGDCELFPPPKKC